MRPADRAMRPRFTVRTVAIATLGLQGFMLSAGAQEYSPPLNRHGQPSFEGIWQALDPSAHFNIEAHGASYGVPAGLGIVTDPPDGRIPYTAAGLAQREDNRGNPAADPIARCHKPGVPHLMYLPFPFQIVQSESFITIMSEYVHNTRFVFLNRDDHYGEGEIDLWNGDSVGRFEDGSLVTDVFNFHPEDFTRPWTIETYLYRHKDPVKQILEYECHAYAGNSLGPPELPEVP
jgi:hypothetical protein